MKVKYGKCVDCSPGTNQKPLTAGRCSYHYWQHRATQNKGKQKLAAPRKQIKNKSTKQAARDRKYSKIRAVWIMEHSVCEIHLVPGCTHHATDIHHMKGKIGDLYFDTEFFKAACRHCHDYVEANPEKAKKWGFSLDRLTIES